MKPRSIGGTLRYELLAKLHRPADQVALQTEVRRLATEQRLSAGEIANALQINPARVRELLAATGTEAAAIHHAHPNARREAP